MSLAIWKTRISYEYKNIQESRKSQIRDEWCENWNKCNQDLADTANSVSWLIKPNVNAKSSKPPIHKLNDVTRIPPMFNWVLTPRSCLVENEKTLLNIPFIGDHKVAHRTFVKDLLQSYENNIPGAQKGKKFDNELFLELVQTLKHKYLPVNERSLPLHPIIFEALSSHCFKGLTPHQLKEKYEQLSNDNGHSDAQPSNSCEHALRTFKKYFCRRCYRYNCDLHRGQEGNFAVSTQVKRNLSFRMKTPDEACGAKCYRLMQSVVGSKNIQPNSVCQSSSDSTEMPSTSKFCQRLSNIESENESNETLAVQNEWSDDEKTLFRVLYNVFPNKYCIIAQSMLTKTCDQVYEYAQAEFQNTLPVPSGSSQISIVPQRRKLNSWVLYKRKQRANNEASFTVAPSYSPCNHPNKSCDNDCSCVSKHHACEKYCNCSLNCSNRFYGCLCQGACSSNKCPCFTALRECDPDLCLKCGAAEYDLSKAECKNISIQRGLRKHLLLAPSDIAGWGVFLKNGARKDEFISEYVGEIISQQEADRRGMVYDMQKCSFLFELNEQFVVDATYLGGKMRFANHSNNPNCYAKVMMVLGDHRIGIFAKRDILPGEEIFFDYRYATDKLQFVSIERELE